MVTQIIGPNPIFHCVTILRYLLSYKVWPFQIPSFQADLEVEYKSCDLQEAATKTSVGDFRNLNK